MKKFTFFLFIKKKENSSTSSTGNNIKYGKFIKLNEVKC